MTNAVSTYNMHLLAAEAELIEETQRRVQLQIELENAHAMIAEYQHRVHLLMTQNRWLESSLIQAQQENQARNTSRPKPQCARRLMF